MALRTHPVHFCVFALSRRRRTRALSTAQITASVPEVISALLGVLRASVTGTFDLAPEQRAMDVNSPCAVAMEQLWGLLTLGNADAVLRGGEEGAALVRAAVTLLRAAPAAAGGVMQRLVVLTMAPSVVLLETLDRHRRRRRAPAAAAAAPELVPLSEIDAAAAALAGVADAVCHARGEADAEGKRVILVAPLESLRLILNAASAAAGAASPPVTAATARAVLRAAAATVAIVPPGADDWHWTVPGAAEAYDILVSTRRRMR